MLLGSFDKKKIDITLFSIAWFIVSMLPYIFLAHHVHGYFMSFALLGPAILLSSGIKNFAYDFKSAYKVGVFALVVVMILSGMASIAAQEQDSYIIRQDQIAKNALTYMQEHFQSLPDGSLIDIGNADETLYWALGTGAAFKLYYPGVDVSFENVAELPAGSYKHVYRFKYENRSISYIGNME
jgi:hypothetical protein